LTAGRRESPEGGASVDTIQTDRFRRRPMTRPKTGSARWAVLAVGLTLLAPLARRAFADDRRVVPEVVGLPADAAEAMLKGAGFVPARRPASGRPAGVVDRQSPGGFSRAATGATVTIDVGEGAARTTPPPPPAAAIPKVPDVRGRSEAEAIETLRDYRVRVEPRDAPPSEEGRIVRQEPAAGTSLARGGDVLLHVGRRAAPDPGTSLIPSVVGLTEERASQLLTASELVPVVVPAASDPADAGKVLSQDPAGGSVVARRSNVTITVGREVMGPLMEAEVPELSGLAESEARARLDGLGLVAAVGYTLAPDVAGRVVSQDPAPGTRLLRGRPVSLRVGVATLVPARVPDVVGLEAAEASRRVAEAGFAVETGTAVSLSGSAGRVVSQEPAGGGDAIRGTTVRIVVGKSVSSPPDAGTSSAATLPNVVGQDETAAREALMRLGLVVEVEGIPGAPGEIGRVKEQVPAANTAVAPGSVVRLRVARGDALPPRPGGLPSYVGMDLAAVQSDLSARGLVGMTRSVPGTPAGRVVAQDPPAGTPVASGSVVQLSVSQGAAGLAPPTLLGPPSNVALPRSAGVTFAWHPVPGAEDYQIEVTVLKGSTWVVADNDVIPGTTKRPAHVKRGAYRWHVRARRDGGRSPGPWSEWRDLNIY
jgi:beta-lactam-binding protein with PASTA domain